MQLIPAIDIIDGKCVRLTQGDYAQKKEYNSNPLEVAKAYEEAGIERLHLVDLDGAKQKKIVNLKILEQIASHTGLHVDFGGGVQSDDDIEAAFNAGARQVTGGSIAVKQPELFESWLQKYGSEKVILGADAKDGQIAVSGWQESSDRELFRFLEEYKEKGVQYVICTDVSKDGLLQGPSTDLYEQIIRRFPELKLVASGGVAGMQDLKDLKAIGCWGAIIGKAIYEGKITMQELATFNKS
jgi:phosphoribosylformimino-5-aminoimidazole carboxamide ribotide isomerase